MDIIKLYKIARSADIKERFFAILSHVLQSSEFIEEEQLILLR